MSLKLFDVAVALSRRAARGASTDETLRMPLASLIVLTLFAAFGCSTTYKRAALDESAALISLEDPVHVPAVEPAEPHDPLDPSRRESDATAAIAMRLEQAQALAIVRHPRLATLRAAHGLADAADIRADTRPDPELSISTSWIVPEAVLGGIASLRWELLPNDAKDARRGLAAALRDSIDAQLASEEWRVAQDVRIAWLEVAHDVRAILLAEKARALAAETRDFGRSMLTRGATTELETSILDVELAEAERNVVSRRGALDLDREKLAEAIGLPRGTRVESSADDDPLEPCEPRIPVGDPDALLLLRVPELCAARARYELAERDLQIAHLGALAKVSVGPDLQRDASSTFLGGGVNTTIPLFDQNRAGIREAEARRTNARLAFTETLFSSRAALAKARAEEQGAARALSSHESTVAPRANDALVASERASAAGAADLLTVLLARQRVLRVEQDGLDLRAAHAIAVARLEAAFGPEPASNSNRSTPTREVRQR